MLPPLNIFEQTQSPSSCRTVCIFVSIWRLCRVYSSVMWASVSVCIFILMRWFKRNPSSSDHALVLGTVLCFVFVFFYLSGPYVKTVDDEVQLYTDINSDEDFVPGRPRHGGWMGGWRGGGWWGGSCCVLSSHVLVCSFMFETLFFFLSFWTWWLDSCSCWPPLNCLLAFTHQILWTRPLLPWSHAGFMSLTYFFLGQHNLYGEDFFIYFFPLYYFWGGLSFMGLHTRKEIFV